LLQQTHSRDLTTWPFLGKGDADTIGILPLLVHFSERNSVERREINQVHVNGMDDMVTPSIVSQIKENTESIASVLCGGNNLRSLARVHQRCTTWMMWLVRRSSITFGYNIGIR